MRNLESSWRYLCEEKERERVTGVPSTRKTARSSEVTELADVRHSGQGSWQDRVPSRGGTC